MKISVVTAQAEHIPHISANLRQADKDELWHFALLRPVEALTRSFMASRMAWTGMVDDVPACMFGVAPAGFLSSLGRPWLLGTPEIENHQMAFLRRNKAKVREMMKCYPTLENYVEATNEKAIAWLKWLRFEFDEVPQNMGPFNKKFIRFHMEP